MLSKLKEKHFDRWLLGFAAHQAKRIVEPQSGGLKHLLFCFCDHYEPLWGGATEDVGEARVEHWRQEYPKLTAQYHDSNGRPPQHSFFFPGEEYRPRFFDRLEPLIEQGLGEVELHLHHHDATSQSVRAEIESYLNIYAERGHFSRYRGRVRYAFIHGNWALANARPDGMYCGVDDELVILHETGCYADFTFPAVPDVAQPNRVNQIYWPTGDLTQRRSYENGRRARAGESFEDRILMIEGPLTFALREGKLEPRIEFSAITAVDPASPSRVRSWVAQNIHIPGCPEWVFVKVHTHGAPEKQAASHLGPGGHALHKALAEYNDGASWQLHYVTAREMYNLAKAAMQGEHGNPMHFLDYELPPPPIRQAAMTRASA